MVKLPGRQSGPTREGEQQPNNAEPTRRSEPRGRGGFPCRASVARGRWSGPLDDMSNQAASDASVVSRRRRLVQLSLLLIFFGMLFLALVAFAVVDSEDAFAVQRYRTGIMGSHYGIGFFMPLVFTGLATVLLIPAVRDAWKQYRLAKKETSEAGDASN